MERFDEIKGRVKRAVGELTDDERLKNEGSVDRGAAGVKGRIDDIADRIKEAVGRDREPDRDREAELSRR